MFAHKIAFLPESASSEAFLSLAHKIPNSPNYGHCKNRSENAVLARSISGGWSERLGGVGGRGEGRRAVGDGGVQW